MQTSGCVKVRDAKSDVAFFESRDLNEFVVCKFYHLVLGGYM